MTEYQRDRLITALSQNILNRQIMDMYGRGYGDIGYGQHDPSNASLAQMHPYTNWPHLALMAGQGQKIDWSPWTQMSKATLLLGRHTGEILDVPQYHLFAPEELIIAHVTDNPRAFGDWIQALEDIFEHRLDYLDESVTVYGPILNSIRSKPWSRQIRHQFKVVFENEDNARYFFNSGGEIRIFSEKNGDAQKPQDEFWQVFLSKIGTIKFSSNATHSLNDQDQVGTSFPIGYYGLSDQWQKIYEAYGSEIVFSFRNSVERVFQGGSYNARYMFQNQLLHQEQQRHAYNSVDQRDPSTVSFNINSCITIQPCPCEPVSCASECTPCDGDKSFSGSVSSQVHEFCFLRAAEDANDISPDGWVEFEYNTFSVPDAFWIYLNDVLIWQTPGYVKGTGSTKFYYSKADAPPQRPHHPDVDFITIRTMGSQAGTAWRALLKCREHQPSSAPPSSSPPSSQPSQSQPASSSAPSGSTSPSSSQPGSSTGYSSSSQPGGSSGYPSSSSSPPEFCGEDCFNRSHFGGGATYTLEMRRPDHPNYNPTTDKDGAFVIEYGGNGQPTNIKIWVNDQLVAQWDHLPTATGTTDTVEYLYLYDAVPTGSRTDTCDIIVIDINHNGYGQHRVWCPDKYDPGPDDCDKCPSGMIVEVDYPGFTSRIWEYEFCLGRGPDYISPDGLMGLEYNAYTVPDTFEIFINDVLVATTGDAVSGTGVVTFYYEKATAPPQLPDHPTRDMVKIRATCASDATSFDAILRCPGDVFTGSSSSEPGSSSSGPGSSSSGPGSSSSGPGSSGSTSQSSSDSSSQSSSGGSSSQSSSPSSSSTPTPTCTPCSKTDLDDCSTLPGWPTPTREDANQRYIQRYPSVVNYIQPNGPYVDAYEADAAHPEWCQCHCYNGTTFSDVDCTSNDAIVSTGHQITQIRHMINRSANPAMGSVVIDYDTYLVPDQIDVYLNNSIAASTGKPVRFNGRLTFLYDQANTTPSDPLFPNYDIVTVIITGAVSGTDWTYMFYCPNESPPNPPTPPENVCGTDVVYSLSCPGNTSRTHYMGPDAGIFKIHYDFGTGGTLSVIYGSNYILSPKTVSSQGVQEVSYVPSGTDYNIIIETGCTTGGQTITYVLECPNGITVPPPVEPPVLPEQPEQPPPDTCCPDPVEKIITKAKKTASGLEYIVTLRGPSCIQGNSTARYYIDITPPSAGAQLPNSGYPQIYYDNTFISQANMIDNYHYYYDISNLDLDNDNCVMRLIKTVVTFRRTSNFQIDVPMVINGVDNELYNVCLDYKPLDIINSGMTTHYHYIGVTGGTLYISYYCDQSTYAIVHQGNTILDSRELVGEGIYTVAYPTPLNPPYYIQYTVQKSHSGIFTYQIPCPDVLVSMDRFACCTNYTAQTNNSSSVVPYTLTLTSPRCITDPASENLWCEAVLTGTSAVQLSDVQGIQFQIDGINFGNTYSVYQQSSTTLVYRSTIDPNQILGNCSEQTLSVTINMNSSVGGQILTTNILVNGDYTSTSNVKTETIIWTDGTNIAPTPKRYVDDYMSIDPIGVLNTNEYKSLLDGVYPTEVNSQILTRAGLKYLDQDAQICSYFLNQYQPEPKYLVAPSRIIGYDTGDCPNCPAVQIYHPDREIILKASGVLGDFTSAPGEHAGSIITNQKPKDIIKNIDLTKKIVGYKDPASPFSAKNDINPTAILVSENPQYTTITHPSGVANWSNDMNNYGIWVTDSNNMISNYGNDIYLLTVVDIKFPGVHKFEVLSNVETIFYMNGHKIYQGTSAETWEQVHVNLSIGKLILELRHRASEHYSNPWEVTTPGIGFKLSDPYGAIVTHSRYADLVIPAYICPGGFVPYQQPWVPTAKENQIYDCPCSNNLDMSFNSQELNRLIDERPLGGCSWVGSQNVNSWNTVYNLKTSEIFYRQSVDGTLKDLQAHEWLIDIVRSIYKAFTICHSIPEPPTCFLNITTCRKNGITAYIEGQHKMENMCDADPVIRHLTKQICAQFGNLTISQKIQMDYIRSLSNDFDIGSEIGSVVCATNFNGGQCVNATSVVDTSQCDVSSITYERGSASGYSSASVNNSCMCPEGWVKDPGGNNRCVKLEYINHLNIRPQFNKLVYVECPPTLCLTSPEPPPTTMVDFVFIFDRTSSMKNYHDRVSDNMESFANTLAALDIDPRFTIVSFGDQADDGELGMVKTYPWWDDTGDFRSELEAIDCELGGDAPESALEALVAATQLTFRSNAKIKFCLITDNGWHDTTDGKSSYSTNQVINMVNRINATVSIAGRPGLRQHSKMALFTGGKLYDISDEKFYSSGFGLLDDSVKVPSLPTCPPEGVIEPPHRIRYEYLSPSSSGCSTICPQGWEFDGERCYRPVQDAWVRNCIPQWTRQCENSMDCCVWFSDLGFRPAWEGFYGKELSTYIQFNVPRTDTYRVRAFFTSAGKFYIDGQLIIEGTATQQYIHADIRLTQGLHISKIVGVLDISLLTDTWQSNPGSIAVRLMDTSGETIWSGCEGTIIPYLCPDGYFYDFIKGKCARYVDSIPCTENIKHVVLKSWHDLWIEEEGDEITMSVRKDPYNSNMFSIWAKTDTAMPGPSGGNGSQIMFEIIFDDLHSNGSHYDLVTGTTQTFVYYQKATRYLGIKDPVFQDVIDLNTGEDPGEGPQITAFSVSVNEYINVTNVRAPFNSFFDYSWTSVNANSWKIWIEPDYDDQCIPESGAQPLALLPLPPLGANIVDRWYPPSLIPQNLNDHYEWQGIDEWEHRKMKVILEIEDMTTGKTDRAELKVYFDFGCFCPEKTVRITDGKCFVYHEEDPHHIATHDKYITVDITHNVRPTSNGQNIAIWPSSDGINPDLTKDTWLSLSFEVYLPYQQTYTIGGSCDDEMEVWLSGSKILTNHFNLHWRHVQEDLDYGWYTVYIRTKNHGQYGSAWSDNPGYIAVEIKGQDGIVYWHTRSELDTRFRRGINNNVVDYGCLVHVSDPRWHPEFNETGIWISRDCINPFQIVDEDVRVTGVTTLAISGVYTFNCAIDNIGRYVLNGSSVIIGKGFAGWASQEIYLDAGELTIEMIGRNINTSNNDWNLNPAGFGFKLIDPHGSVVCTSRTINIPLEPLGRLVPFHCPKDYRPNIGLTKCVLDYQTYCASREQCFAYADANENIERGYTLVDLNQFHPIRRTKSKTLFFWNRRARPNEVEGIIFRSNRGWQMFTSERYLDANPIVRNIVRTQHWPNGTPTPPGYTAADHFIDFGAYEGTVASIQTCIARAEHESSTPQLCFRYIDSDDNQYQGWTLELDPSETSPITGTMNKRLNLRGILAKPSEVIGQTFMTTGGWMKFDPSVYCSLNDITMSDDEAAEHFIKYGAFASLELTVNWCVGYIRTAGPNPPCAMFADTSYRFQGTRILSPGPITEGTTVNTSLGPLTFNSERYLRANPHVWMQVATGWTEPEPQHIVTYRNETAVDYFNRIGAFEAGRGRCMDCPDWDFTAVGCYMDDVVNQENGWGFKLHHNGFGYYLTYKGVMATPNMVRGKLFWTTRGQYELFTEEEYVALNPDVKDCVTRGYTHPDYVFDGSYSAAQHFIDLGAFQGRFGRGFSR